MIQRLLQIQKQKLKRAQQKIDPTDAQPFKTNSGFVTIGLGQLSSIPETTRVGQKSNSQYESKTKHAPLTDRATFNRKMIFIKTRNRYSTHYLSKFKTHTEQSYSNSLSRENPVKDYFCAVPLTKKTIIHRKNSKFCKGAEIEQYLPICSKIHKIGYKLEDPSTSEVSVLNFKKAKSFTARSLNKKRTVQFMSSTKIRVGIEMQRTVNKGLASDSIQISPWKYIH